MEKLEQHFKSLSEIEKLQEISRLTKELIRLRKQIDKNLETTKVIFSSNSHSNARRNASNNSKVANMNKVHSIYYDYVKLLKLYSELI